MKSFNQSTQYVEKRRVCTYVTWIVDPHHVSMSDACGGNFVVRVHSIFNAFLCGGRAPLKGISRPTRAPLKMHPLLFTTLYGPKQPKNTQNLCGSIPLMGHGTKHSLYTTLLPKSSY